MAGRWHIDENTQFVNPYNFVPLTECDPKREPLAQSPQGFTGVLRCRLTVKTPLALPDHEGIPNDNTHHEYPFFKIGGKPLIPGSELRGMIRSIYEAITNSCLSTLDTKPLTGRVKKPKLPGLLKRSGSMIELYTAKTYVLNTISPYGQAQPFNITAVPDSTNPRLYKDMYLQVEQEQKRNGDSVWFKIGGYYPKGNSEIICDLKANDPHDPAYEEGFLLLAEKGLFTNRSHRHFSHVFVKLDKVCDLPEAAINNLNSVLEYYRDEKVNNALRSMKKGTQDEHTGYLNYHIPRNGQYMPVFFDIVDSYIYLSPSQIGREVYYNTLSAIAEQQNHHEPCNGNELCPACRLFGTVGNSRAVGSRVRFGDAVPQGEYDLANHFVTLKELAGPKISATEFYTYRPNHARTWNYDYITMTQQATTRLQQTIRLRGRKFYLHPPQLRLSENDYKSEDRNERNCSVQLLKRGSFVFDVYVDHLTEQELKKLVWCLSPNDGTGKKYYHKLGFGKPLGLGSIEIELCSIEQRKAEWQGEGDLVYSTAPVYDEQHPFSFLTSDELNEEFSAENGANDYPQTLKSLLKILDKDCIDQSASIAYPIAQRGHGLNSAASHQWFSGNKQLLMDATGIDENVDMTLPLVTAASLHMPKLVYDSQDSIRANVPSTVKRSMIHFPSAALQIGSEGQTALNEHKAQLNTRTGFQPLTHTRSQENTDTSLLIGHTARQVRPPVQAQTAEVKKAVLTVGQIYEGKITGNPPVKGVYCMMTAQGECYIRIDGRIDMNKKCKFKVTKEERTPLFTFYICQPA